MTSGQAVSSDPNCIFCKIIDGKIPSEKVAEDDRLIAIRDVSPQAPTHILVIPRNHIPNLAQVEDGGLVGALFQRSTRIAEEQGLKNGYRIVVNTGDDGGQTVHHLHIHVIGGRAMQWPPG
ncbi:MAG TPA: histidine triad nucleotide-binding protein [Oculatellaceae cyanobacterium]